MINYAALSKKEVRRSIGTDSQFEPTVRVCDGEIEAGRPWARARRSSAVVRREKSSPYFFCSDNIRSVDILG